MSSLSSTLVERLTGSEKRRITKALLHPYKDSGHIPPSSFPSSAKNHQHPHSQSIPDVVFHKVSSKEQTSPSQNPHFRIF